MNRHILVQIAIFAVISVVALAYGYRYISSDLATYSNYELHAELSDVSGLATGMRVNYRGRDVGVVSDTTIRDRKIAVVVRIDGDVRIPVGSSAQVTSSTVLGDKYLDVRPTTAQGPMLDDGGVLDTPDELAPVPLEELFADVYSSLSAVDTEALESLVGEVSTTLEGTGPELAGIIENTSTLARAVNESAPTLSGLVDVGVPVARDLASRSGKAKRTVTAMRDVSEQFRREEPSLVYLLDDSPGAMARIQRLLDDNRKTGGALLANGVVVTDVLASRREALRESFVVGPEGFRALSGIVKDGRADFQLVATQGPVCVYPTERREVNDSSEREAHLDLYCPMAEDLGIRGAEAAPRPDDRGRANSVRPGDVTGPEYVEDPLFVPLGEEVVESWEKMLRDPGASAGG